MSVTPSAAISPVLIVEDDELVRMMATEMLEDAGIAVLEATNADEAWQLLEQRSDIRVLFTDVDMPGSMNGFVLAQRVAERWPHIRLVITSGRFQPNPDDVPDDGQFVTKPYRAPAVLRAIAAAG
ncbi:response regulator receiver protein [Methylobacterium variabile]|jgi:CheY-like chemotaxis protein|uniref:Response regulator receiver protein n=1 Tax=Methylobacterium variabile TaxID=298794 RepID=A0A0J6T6G3_9HYPH|nr:MULTISPECIES: response regulator [Methylobacterium]KMO41559.1 response regulator receiver protein [Methylobacterium variabile]NGM37313.1 response regulator [Methylobacterium sp. DB0501]UHC20334.1 response regulator [Methylobacterium currus]